MALDHLTFQRCVRGQGAGGIEISEKDFLAKVSITSKSIFILTQGLPASQDCTEMY
jgi:hypothetical protein